ncbi:MAG: iron-containing alcohol dehydrogenase [Actinomycetota bacterium]|nr:iron-containing alcohol dehydrogenase [Actinomycetota bacterium]
MIVRWGLDELPGLLTELEIERSLLIASSRWSPDDVPVEVVDVWTEVPSHRIDDATEAARAADGVVALGGGSAIDLGKAISAETGLPLVSVPTTYAGAEWTPFFGIRDPDRRMKGGGSGAHLAGAVYEPHLTYALPRSESVGTAMNALAHAAEALYVKNHNAEADREALQGATLIAEWLPKVAAAGFGEEGREPLLRGAMHAGAALGKSGLALGHAIAQALGGRYGLPHGAMNAISLPAALRFNEPVAHDAIARFAGAIGTEDAAARAEELARLGGFERLRDFGVPEQDLPEVAEATAERAGAKANPRPASPVEIEELLRSVW